MASLPIFQGPEHQPFQLAGRHNGLALLIHGFPGTPAEMRPLGEVLQQAGWHVEGMLLPGFGSQITAIGSCRYQDWLAAIGRRLAQLRREHGPTVLVGYSMGAALAIGVAAENAPHALVLLAPFWRLDAGWRGMLLPILKWAFPHFRPFEKADFSDLAVQKTIYSFAPDIDLGDPAVQAAIRQLSIPSRVIDELRKAGRYASRNASRIGIPVLIVQGAQDTLVKPAHSRELSQRFVGPVQYREVQAGHDLLHAEGDAWRELTNVIIHFIAPFAPSTPIEHDDGKGRT